MITLMLVNLYSLRTEKILQLGDIEFYGFNTVGTPDFLNDPRVTNPMNLKISQPSRSFSKSHMSDIEDAI